MACWWLLWNRQIKQSILCFFLSDLQPMIAGSVWKAKGNTTRNGAFSSMKLC